MSKLRNLCSCVTMGWKKCSLCDENGYMPSRIDRRIDELALHYRDLYFNKEQAEEHPNLGLLIREALETLASENGL